MQEIAKYILITFQHSWKVIPTLDKTPTICNILHPLLDFLNLNLQYYVTLSAIYPADNTVPSKPTKNDTAICCIGASIVFVQNREVIWCEDKIISQRHGVYRPLYLLMVSV